MLCETCRYTERPGFVRARSRAGAQSSDEMIPCPDCGGQGIGHCCDGICEQPDLNTQQGKGAQGKPAP